MSGLDNTTQHRILPKVVQFNTLKKGGKNVTDLGI